MRILILLLLACSGWSQTLMQVQRRSAAGHTYTVQVKTAADAVANPPSTTCTFSPAAQSGDLIVAIGVDSNDAESSPAPRITVTDDHSNTYHLAILNNTATYLYHRAVYAWGVASGTSVVTLTGFGFEGLEGVCYLIHDSAGAYAADPLDTGSTPSGGADKSVLFTTGSYTFPSLTPSATDGVVIATANEATGAAVTWTGSGGGWTTGATFTSNPAMLTQYLVNAAVTAYTPTITATGSNIKYQGSIVSFKHP